MKLFLAPHSDDETLFGAYSIISHKPLVIVFNSKDLTEERKEESRQAMKILGVEVIFIDLEGLKRFKKEEIDVVFAPMLEGGHPFHDIVSEYATSLFKDRIIYYSTYRSRKDLQPKGPFCAYCDLEMIELKEKALACYKSQILATPCHFALKIKDEYYG